VSAPPPLPASSDGRKPRRPLEYLLLNLSFPGIGSYQAGWRLSGVMQASLGGLGFLLTNVFAFWFCRLWYQSGEFPVLTLLRAEVMPRSWFGPFLLGLAGVVLFLIALGWAFVTSLIIAQQARK